MLGALYGGSAELLESVGVPTPDLNLNIDSLFTIVQTGRDSFVGVLEMEGRSPTTYCQGAYGVVYERAE